MAKPWLKPSNCDSGFHCLPWAKWCNESETLGELLAYPLYTFLMNRPLGLIKEKKRLIVSPNSCKLFTLHLCRWLIKEQRSVGTAQGGCNYSGSLMKYPFEYQHVSMDESAAPFRPAVGRAALCPGNDSINWRLRLQSVFFGATIQPVMYIWHIC